MRAPPGLGPTTAGPSCSTHDASPPMCAWQNARTFAIGSSPSSSVKVNSRSSSTLMGKDTSTPLGGAGFWLRLGSPTSDDHMLCQLLDTGRGFGAHVFPQNSKSFAIGSSPSRTSRVCSASPTFIGNDTSTFGA